MKPDAAAMQARAACLHAALLTRRAGDGAEQVIAKAEEYWAWVSQPTPGTTADKPKRPR